MRRYLLAFILVCAARADVVDRFFESEFHFHPTEATSDGFHQYDDKLEDYFPRLDRRWRSRRSKVFCLQVHDELVLSHIRAGLLDLETRRVWENNPDIYSGGLSNSAFTIMSRRYASAAVRLRSLFARERQMPKALDAARVNLKNPPRIYTEIALEQLPGIVSFFEKDVPAAFTEVKDPKLIAEFQPANRTVIDALNSYRKFLSDGLLPKSHGGFPSRRRGVREEAAL